MTIACDLETGVQRKFLEDVVNVALDRIHCKIEPGGNLLVAQSFGDQFDHFPFPVRHPNRLERIAFSVPGGMSGNLGKERRGEGGGEDLLSPRDVPNRLEEIVEGRISEDKPGNTGLYIFNKRWLGGGKVHQNHSSIGIGLSDRLD